MIGRSDNRSQRRHHLQANNNENHAPKFQMGSRGAAEQMAHRFKQPQTKHDPDRPQTNVQRSHERNGVR